LRKIEKEHSNLINSVRGLGTFGAFDAPNMDLRDDIIIRLRNAGVSTGPCGPVGIRLRPSLTFTKTHADIFFDKLKSVLKQF
jgi:4-aminobutyrate aminotransferase / (S)-3-amino-2-methylpropionate transaminase